jgi:cell division protein FtsI/penicillin-binding protein 2
LIEDGLLAAQIEPLREGVRLVLNADSGTGKATKSDRVIIAGKTGTAQNWRREQSRRTIMAGWKRRWHCQRMVLAR